MQPSNGYAAPVTGVTTTDLEAVERALQRFVRRANLPRLHERFSDEAGVALDRGAYHVLCRVEEWGSLRVTDLARALGVEPSTVSRHVSQLDDAGYLERGVDPADRRVCTVSLTGAGTTALERFRLGRARVISEVLADWEDDDIARLARLLDRFAGDLIEYADRL
jgi:DNA-binding MarR family transcriptional regulator